MEKPVGGLMAGPTRRSRRGGVLGAAGAAAILAGAGLAQAADLAPDRDPSGVVSELVVTAMRRTSTVDETDAALSAFSQAALQATNTRTFEDLARLDPSIQLSAYQGEMQLFMRGVGAVTFVGGFDTSVAVSLDGVYLSRPSAIAPAFFDLDRVEVLKGPQGVLYGRNATGGAVNLVTRGPTQTWTREAALTRGNYDAVEALAAVSGPLSDNLALRIAVGANHRDGYTRLMTSGQDGALSPGDAEDRKDITARLRLDWTPSNRLSTSLSADYFRADDRAVVFHFAGPGYDNNPAFNAWIGQGQLGPVSEHTVFASVAPYNRPKNWGVSGRMAYDLGGATLMSLTSLRRTQPENYTDMSNSTVLGESQFKAERARQFSQDLQLVSSEATRLTYLAGLSYFRERNTIRNEFQFPFVASQFGLTPSPECCVLRADGQTRTDALAAFGEVRYAVTPRLRATLGGRYSHERRGGFNLLDYRGLLSINVARFTPATFNGFTPRAVLEFRPGAGQLLYASATKGFKAGGFNVGSAQNTPYAPEKVWSYELGSKLTAAQGRLRVNLAAFHYDYTDLQVQDVIDNSVLIRNAATAKIDGFEAALTARPTAVLALDAAATWLEARFDQYETVNTKTPTLGVLDLSGNPLPQAPRLKAHGGAEMSLPLGAAGALRLRGDVNWQGRVYFSAFKDPRARQDGFWWLKARATWSPTNGPYEVAAFMDNITNEQVFTNISITGDLDGSRALGNMAPPRTFGVRFSYSR
jgi:iron complex outermembrane receptor protein